MVVSQGMLGYGLTSVVGAIPAEIFQGRHYGSIFGTLMLASIAGGAVGPVAHRRAPRPHRQLHARVLDRDRAAAWSPRWRSGSRPRARCGRSPANYEGLRSSSPLPAGGAGQGEGPEGEGVPSPREWSILPRVSEPPPLGLHARRPPAHRGHHAGRPARGARGHRAAGPARLGAGARARRRFARDAGVAGRRGGGPHRAPRPARVLAHHGGPSHRGARAAPAARTALRADHRAGPGPLHPDAHRRRHPLGRRGRAAARGVLRPVPAAALRLRAHPVPDLRGGGRDRSAARRGLPGGRDRHLPHAHALAPLGQPPQPRALAGPMRPTAPSSWTRSRGCAPWPPSARARRAPGCSRSAAAPSSRPPCGCSAPIPSRAASATCASRWARPWRWRSAAIACRAGRWSSPGSWWC